MPFDFLRKKGKEESKPAKGGAKGAAKAPEPAPPGTPVPFDGLTEEWRLVGTMYLESRLSDALNKREAVAIADVKWAPIDGSADFSAVPGLKSVDPYDLIVVIAGEASKSAMSDADKAAARGQKAAYEVSLEVPPLRIVGTVYLAVGLAPERLMDRSAEMFVPVVGGVAYLGDRVVSGEGADAILVNRFYLRGVTVTRGKEGDEPLTEAPPPWARRSRDTAQPPAVQPPVPPAPQPRSETAPPWPSADVPRAAAPRPAPQPAAPPPVVAAPPPTPPPATPATSAPPAVPSRPEVEWPATDRKPDPRVAPRPPEPEWPAADRKPEPPGRASNAPTAQNTETTRNADETRIPETPTGPEAVEKPVSRMDESSPAAEDDSAAGKGSPGRRDPGAKGWPTPETGCRPKRGGLGPRG